MDEKVNDEDSLELQICFCDDNGDLCDYEPHNEMSDSEAAEYLRLGMATRFIKSLGLKEELLGDVKEWEISYSRGSHIRFKFPTGVILRITVKGYNEASYISRVQGNAARYNVRETEYGYENFNEDLIASVDTECIEDFLEFIATTVR